MTKASDYYVSRGLTLSMHLEAWETIKGFLVLGRSYHKWHLSYTLQSSNYAHSSASVDLI